MTDEPPDHPERARTEAAVALLERRPHLRLVASAAAVSIADSLRA